MRSARNPMPHAAKAFFTVTAGIIPGDVIQHYSRQWCYTSDEYEKDRASTGQSPAPIFRKYQAAAEEYAREITDPALVNWVRCEFLWV